MKILSIIAQKPSSTGSGIYLSELVKCFKKMGHEQEIICATYENELTESNVKPNAVKLCEPVYNRVVFNTKDLPIKIAGMSDVMPYETIKYSDLAQDSKMLAIWENAFREKFTKVIDRFKPDLIICHHLYLLTAMVVDYVSQKHIKVYGICHNTDLRQYQQTDLKRDFIKENIKKLDKVFAPSAEHRDKLIELFDVDKDKTSVIGIGYNGEIFKNEKLREKLNSNHLPTQDKNTYKILYVGKIAKKKGVLSLIKAFKKIENNNLQLDLIGGAGDKKEYDEILEECKGSKNQINIIPAMSQTELSREYNSHDLFVLPSFSEGIPIVPLEAMACGCKVVISDLAGVKNFYNSNIKNSSIKYVPLPKLTNVDDTSDEELELFESRLAKSITESIDDKSEYSPELSNLSWEHIANQVLFS